ncbi:TetR-like C-terminal domain-containing protein [Actinoallomurus sp. NPDC050550]|uniref:TetR-like C-terminal domain-containing protein n=1 Tax=Actinoallomurus sp. NPDC050550 TaxID=3154937 RepID=UPI003407B01F
MTAVAAAGFRGLGEALAAADAGPDASARFTALGRAYLRFGLDNPALFDLMFRPDQLHADDPNLQAAQQQSFAVLRQATAGISGRPQEPEAAQELALLAWAAAHGLVALVRDGALQAMAGTTAQGTARSWRIRWSTVSRTACDRPSAPTRRNAQRKKGTDHGRFPSACQR